MDAGRAIDAGEVGDRPAEHLIAAAEAENPAAAAKVGGDVDVEAGGAQGGEVRERGLRSGEKDEIGVTGERLRAVTLNPEKTQRLYREAALAVRRRCARRRITS